MLNLQVNALQLRTPMVREFQRAMKRSVTSPCLGPTITGLTMATRNSFTLGTRNWYS